MQHYLNEYYKRSLQKWWNGKRVKIILTLKSKYKYSSPSLSPTRSPKRRNYKPGRFKLPFQKNVLIFHCEPLWRENTKLTACLQPNVTLPSNCVFVKPVHMSIYYTRINNSAFNRAQTVINHSYDSNKWGTFPKVQGVFWPQQWGKMDSEVRRISLYACIDCQSLVGKWSGGKT